MTLSTVQRLALKDIYLSRWIVLGSIAAGLMSLAIAPISEMMFYVGNVAYICVLVVLNIFLVMANVVQERKDKVLLFVLSLPVSTSQYTAAKIGGNVLAFGAPWLLLTAASVITIDVSAIPNGLIPAQIAVSGYFLLYFCVLFGVALTCSSVGAMTTAIVVGNISINFAIPLILRLPSQVSSRSGPSPVWGTDVIAVTLLELAGAALALAVAYVRQTRRTDLV